MITTSMMGQVLGVDSEFCNVEALVTGMVDNWPEILLKRRRLFTMGLCFFMFLLGLPMCTEVKFEMDQFTSPNRLLIFILFQTFLGRSVLVPTDGFLFSLWHVFVMGVFLPNHRHWMVLRGWEVLWLCRGNDDSSPLQVLVSVLEILCSRRHDCRIFSIELWTCSGFIVCLMWDFPSMIPDRVRLLRHLLPARDLRQRLRISQMGGNSRIVPKLVIHELCTWVCTLLPNYSPWNIRRGK